MTRSKLIVLLALFVVAGCTTGSEVANEANYVRGDLITFTGTETSPNGAWCWFQDERVIVDASHSEHPVLLFTSISASISDSTEQGDLDLHWYGLNDGRVGMVELYDRLGQDDHNVAALFQMENDQVIQAI